MAKKRRNVFNTEQSKKEIQKEAKAIEKAALQDKEVKSSKKVENSSSSSQKRLYVDDVHHSAAKIKAVKRDMPLRGYIEWLIDQDEI